MSGISRVDYEIQLTHYTSAASVLREVLSWQQSGEITARTIRDYIALFEYLARDYVERMEPQIIP